MRILIGTGNERRRDQANASPPRRPLASAAVNLNENISLNARFRKPERHERLHHIHAPDVVDSAIATDAKRWGQYMATLRASGQFDGGSAIGKDMVFKKDCAGKAATTPVSGYLRIRARSVEAARAFLIGNPNYEAGGTVEIRELPRS